MLSKLLQDKMGIPERVIAVANKAESDVSAIFDGFEEVAAQNTAKVLFAMQERGLSEEHLTRVTGYGYNDTGRDILEDIYAKVFGCEAALVRPQLISGTHALSVALGGNLRFGDELLSPAGTPYDTLLGVIGSRKTKNSLVDNGVTYNEINLIDDSFDYKKIGDAITKKTKIALIQRSRGYALRKSFSVREITELIAFIKSIKHDIICLVDNCYGEFTEQTEPGETGADIVVGSLIKNPGGTLAETGGYIAGRKEFVDNAADRLTAPGLNGEIGPGLGFVSNMLKGFFHAPDVVCSCLKTAVFAARVFEILGFPVLPEHTAPRSDIVQSIIFGCPDLMRRFCEGIQAASPVNSFVRPIPGAMPGYIHEIIMASGGFTQGASIELSADGPMREPYAAHLQGAINYYHGKIGVIVGASRVV